MRGHLWGDPQVVSGRDIALARAQAYKNVFTGLTGELVLEDMKRLLGFYQTTFSADPYVTANNEGKRAVLVAIMNTIEAADHPEIMAEVEEEEFDA